MRRTSSAPGAARKSCKPSIPCFTKKKVWEIVRAFEDEIYHDIPFLPYYVALILYQHLSTRKENIVLYMTLCTRERNIWARRYVYPSIARFSAEEARTLRRFYCLGLPPLGHPQELPTPLRSSSSNHPATCSDHPPDYYTSSATRRIVAAMRARSCKRVSE